MTDASETWLDLDWPLNRLLHNAGADQPGVHRRGILLPSGGDPGTGNVVIHGRPGTGKSTLAMQIAVAAARNRAAGEGAVASFYVALEESTAGVLSKARTCGWGDQVAELKHFGPTGTLATPEALARGMRKILGRPAPGQGPGVWVCTLSPRPLVASPDPAALFKERFAQLERLVVAAHAVNHDAAGPAPGGTRVGLVCIDSLGMFGFPPGNRESAYRLFDLFRRYGVIGLFVAADDDQNWFDSTLADVVIALKIEQDHGYDVRYLAVEKSRYRKNVDGIHPFKIPTKDQQAAVGAPASREPQPPTATRAAVPPPASDEPRLRQRSGLHVYPSLHWSILQRTPPASRPAERNMGLMLGDETFNRVLSGTDPRVLLFKGVAGTFKTAFATNFLVQGLADDEDGLLIRLGDTLYFDPEKHLESRPLSALTRKSLANSKWTFAASREPWRGEPWFHGSKVAVGHWVADPAGAASADASAGAGAEGPHLVEVAFRTGALLPEEFMHAVEYLLTWQECKLGRAVRRVVLDDVAAIGVSYPFLRWSRTSGKEFLPQFVRIMRNYGVRLVMTGTVGDLADANDAAGRAEAAADDVVTCAFSSVFGDRHVTISGPGLRAGHAGDLDSGSESVPPVVCWEPEVRDTPGKSFRLDSTKLQGLVGFGSHDVRRPGILLHLFTEYYEATNGGARHRGLHARYSRSVETLIRSAFGRPVASPAAPRDSSDVAVHLFGSTTSGVIHDSLKHLVSGPLDRTVLYTLDEFWETAGQAGESIAGRLAQGPRGLDDDADPANYIVAWPRGAPVRPFYANVLLLAYRRTLGGRRSGSDGPPSSWSEVLKRAQEISSRAKSATPGSPAVSRPFEFDTSASETLSCMLMDNLISGTAGSNGRAGGGTPGPFDRFLTDPDERWLDAARTQQELRALAELLYLSGLAGDENTVLSPDAGVYLCWYSQLRDLIERHPELATQLDVWPLPGGGFRGDWYVGVARGSVSVQLGQGLLNILCSRSEQYERFRVGVGLPVLKDFAGGGGGDPVFHAWPRGTHVPLGRIVDIHAKAWRRSDIPHYQQFNSALVTIARRLTKPHGSGSAEPAWNVIRHNVARLRWQVRVLGGPVDGAPHRAAAAAGSE